MRKIFLFMAITMTAMTVSAADALSGMFTINSDGDQVVFSKGNLQAAYDGTKWNWFFATKQWDYVGDATANTSITGNGTVSVNDTVDLFGWSTAATYYGINKSQTSSDYSGEFEDWSNNIGEGWHTLSTDEWVYIFYGRTDAKKLFGMGLVNGVNGMILLPDDWSGDKFTDTENGLSDQGSYYYNENGTNYSFHTLNAKQWSEMEANGAVFLPAAGLRDGEEVHVVGSNGYYWSSTPEDGPDGYIVNFNSDGLFPQSRTDRDGGLSVRLVIAAPSGATRIDQTPFPSGEGWGEASKILKDGQLFILRDHQTYTLTGQEIR